MKKILVIEDNTGVRETTADLLELANYNVATAENGKIGVEKARHFAPDLILCDIMMPELDGYGVLYLLSKNLKTANIPFIFMTAKSEKSDVRKGMNMGADDYLTKPFEEIELLDIIETRLKKNDFFKKEFTKDLNGINTFFSDASSLEELKNLSKDRKIVKYEKKTKIYREGNQSYKLYFIHSGKVKTSKTADSGKEFITGIFGAGDFLGAMSLLGELGVYKESAITMEDTEICAISKEDFTTLIFSNKMVSNAFIKLLSDNLVEREDQLMHLAYDSVRQRIAKKLIELSSKTNLNNDASQSINITREDLAGYIGVAKETLCRTLSQLKEDRLILIENRNITILDNLQLTRVADSGYL
jgi:DNA-binding response OmpR family regulator